MFHSYLRNKLHDCKDSLALPSVNESLFLIDPQSIVLLKYFIIFHPNQQVNEIKRKQTSELIEMKFMKFVGVD